VTTKGKPTLQDSRLFVDEAIARCEEAERGLRAALKQNPANAKIESPERLAARSYLREMENEFGWQWKNVRAILQAKERED
jgi:hypothetical protein